MCENRKSLRDQLQTQMHAFAVLTFVTFAFGLCQGLGADARHGYSVLVLNKDRNTDGPVDLKVQVRITDGLSNASIDLECLHRTLGSGDWLVRILAVEVPDRELERKAGAIAKVIADSIPLAEEFLRRDYFPHPLRAVQLPGENMPSDFATRIHEAVAAQMRELSSRPKVFFDPLVRKFLQSAFDRNEPIQLIKSNLKKRGYMANATPPELTGIRRALVGKTWREIASENDAGLEPGSDTVCFDIQRKNED